MTAQVSSQRPTLMAQRTESQSTEDEDADAGRIRRPSWNMEILEMIDYVRMDMWTAASVGDVETVKEFITRGEAVVEEKNAGGWTPLMYAAYIGHDAVCRFLLDSGAGTEATNPRGQTPLMLAATCGNDKTCKLLLENHADLSSRDAKGWTPLFYATLSNHLNVVKVLLRSGADPNELDSALGQNCFHTACENGHELLVDVFLNYGADMNMLTNAGDSARTLATNKKRLKVLLMLDAHRQCPRNDLSTFVLPQKPLLVASDFEKVYPQKPLQSQSAAKPDAPASPKLPNASNSEFQYSLEQASSSDPEKENQSEEIPGSVAAIMGKIGVEKYLGVLEAAGVDTVEKFMALKDEDIKGAGIKLLGPRKKIINAIAKWKSQEPQPPEQDQ